MILAAGGSLTHQDLITFFISVALLIGLARLFGEIAQKFKQPAILGELLVGVLLGPSCLGMLAPDVKNYLFPSAEVAAKTGSNVAIGLQFFSALAIALFLLLAGMEINLRSAFKQGKKALSISLGGMVIPFAFGIGACYLFPELLGMNDAVNSKPLAFKLFFATALSISALPVIARILMDLKLIKSHMGVTILTAAVVNDLIGWMIFAMILGMIGASGDSLPIPAIITITVLFAAFMFTVGTKIITKIYPWIQAHFSWPAGPLSFIITGGLLCAAFTEWLGIHAIFGTFIFGVAVGQCPHIREKTIDTLESFISFIITPIFFASIGLEVNFFSSFNFPLVMLVLFIGTVGKIGGSWVGGRMGGLSNVESMAIGSAMNARGVMEIILGLIAYKAGLINEELFVALVVLALLTSMTSGTLVQKILRRRVPAELKNLLNKELITIDSDVKNKEELFNSLAEKAAVKANIEQDRIVKLLTDREALASTGLENGIAIPHCRLPGLPKPIISLVTCKEGIDFSSIDGSLSHTIFMIMTDENDVQSQLEIISEIATLFSDKDIAKKFLNSATPTEAIAFINSHQKAETLHGDH